MNDISSLIPSRLRSALTERRSIGRSELLSGPIRGELLGTDQLAEKARTVARAQRYTPRGAARRGALLLTRLTDTRHILHDVHARLVAGADRGVDVGPAGEWLLDNFHVVTEHIREVKETLPRSYYRELPELTIGSLAGYPRVYELAITLISHSEARVDRENLELLVAAFQEVGPLSLGELWALPAMLRLALIESVRRMALRTVQRMDEIEIADEWATRIEAASREGVAAHGEALDAFVRAPPRLTAVFITRFLHQLRLGRGSYQSIAQIEEWISDRAVPAEEARARSTQHLALTQVMMAHSIMSLRAISRIDWKGVVERQSEVEAALRLDPSGFYPRMTFATRDAYRHVVERISQRTGHSETDVALAAVDLAREGARAPADPEGGKTTLLRSHVGYYLVDDGLVDLEAATSYRPGPRQSAHRWILAHPNAVFVGSVLTGTFAALAAVLWLAGPFAITAWLLVILVALIPASDIAISVVNQLVTAFLPPRSLPKLDMNVPGGIPAEFRTAVVIPTLFDSVEAVTEALENLEVQFLANREAHLHFAVLSDFTDADREALDGDEAIVAAAVEGVRALNTRYATALGDAFHLFHRPRRWNPRQGVWMGWERKRGKLAEFNRFLRGGAADAFSAIEGNVDPLRGVRYVITLDADTILPPDAAPGLVGALAHPLNRAVYDEAEGRVVRGYGILQPRVGISLPSAHRSRFARVHSGHPGVDPYTTAVSDVYQDLYGEGSFTGKGIYEVDAFELATHGRFPENTLLSHDLIEGSYARAGLATEITVYDDYPARYLTHTRRKHRWIRGDWQLLGWLTPKVPGPDGPEPNRLSLLSRWKILDNLRRSTVEIGQLVFLTAGWTVLPGSPLRWTALGLAAIAAPWIVSVLLAALRPPLDKSWRAYYGAVGRDAVTSAQQFALVVVFLPHQAWISADAIVRTGWRLLVSRRNLLEWQTASTMERSMTASARGVWRVMTPALATVGAIGVLVVAAALAADAPLRRGELILAVSPLIALWLAAPSVAHSLSAPPERGNRQLPGGLRQQAMRYALLHWNYFDRFVGEETHWLVPDNFQEEPIPLVAMRTSPTNIGLHLLAIGSAHDLGFISAGDMARRLELAFRSLERMRRFRGHFFNWYDLTDLRVLDPAYVSTVDSGNLAGHLLAIRQACLAADFPSVVAERLVPALRTGLDVAMERIEELAASGHGSFPRVEPAIRVARAELSTAIGTLADNTGEHGATRDGLESITSSLELARGALADAGLTPELALRAEEWIGWSLDRVEDHLASETSEPGETSDRLKAIAERAFGYVMEMDFRFLFDEERELFSIGYQVASHSCDPSYYDLFASEARLASFIAIAKNDIPLDHWFRLGRSLTHAAGETALVSWSGSMFEYLMPALVMRSFPFTVLDQSYHGAVRRQVAYGVERRVPWGVSESAYNLRDRHLTYQYRAFGVPDLALKRGLGRDLVIAPYASALAVMVEPQRSLENLAALEAKGAMGRYGFRDALDYTRPEPGKRYAVVANYMAHHLGMSLAALTNALREHVWQERFHSDPMVRSAELLLHERIPRRLILQKAQETRTDEALPDPNVETPAVREFDRPDTPRPHIALLGGAPYTVMVSHSGSGYSHFEDLAVTRWRADSTTDAWGQFCYVRDVTTGHTWSAAHQPTCVTADRYHALLATDRATFVRSDGGIETRTEIAVVPEDAAEVRSVTVTNETQETREIELTSYGEIVLGAADADRAHPAFAKLFVETEWHEWCTAITATRRPRSATERSLWCVHVVDAGKHRVGKVTYETDRSRFLGRGSTPRAPAALAAGGSLSGTTGAVLDPVFALRARVRLEAGESATVVFTTLVAASRRRAFELASRYHDPHAGQRALDLAWTTQQVELRELGLTPADAAVFQEIAGLLVYPTADLRAPPEELLGNEGSQPLLWAAGISGDHPIVLATISAEEGLKTLRQLFVAHRYWRRRGMTVDLVILNTHPSSYFQELHEKILEAMFAANDAEMDRPGGVYIRRGDMLGADTLLMLRGSARVCVTCDGRTLARLLESIEAQNEEEDEAAPGALPRREPRPPGIASTSATAADGTEELDGEGGIRAPIAPRSSPLRVNAATAGIETVPAHPGAPRTDLLFDNGIGGLNADGDYEIRVGGDSLPPAPWANVVGNPHGGFIVTERGGGFTWAENSYFYRLTPWHNDPVSDPVSEAIYLRDVESDILWSATPAPVASEAEYRVQHRAGSSVFECEHEGIATRLTMGMAEGEAVKLSLLQITNRDSRSRRIDVTAYAEWTLGVHREQTQHQVRTIFDADLGAIVARNFFDPQFATRAAFFALSEGVTSYTADRHGFLGRNGSAADPAALHLGPLHGATGTNLDPCAALQTVLDLGPGETREIVVILGAVPNVDDARDAVTRFRDVSYASAALARSAAEWRDRLSVVSVRTPDPAFDAMINRWMLYQALSCRIWGRSALYQSSGAYGFRDQLQDVLALVYAEPATAREQIVRAAARQFVEGDVQHWWHPQSGRGVRTRFSDDLVWLPYVVDRYIAVTGDTRVLDEYVPFLAMRMLEPHEHEVYDLPTITDEHASVYEHCLRALRRACTAGEHGLPLIGIGDWNDGMNRVGVEGRGESVWLAWFLIATLRAFAERADGRGDGEVAADFLDRAAAYEAAVEAHGWDGDWYRRAYFDDGTPLGSSTSDECRIDSLAQSWSVISGAGSTDRQARAMRSLERHLVDPEARVIRLLTPAFDKTTKDPGYIKGYLPGVRENGAQYTHAALWAVLATAMRGDGDRAFELYQMLNPLNHARTPEEVEQYKVEPYVVAADVYTAPGQVGRGGWTWYTGAASWMYRVGLEGILGFTKRGDTLTIDPRIPRAWPEFAIEYRFGESRYSITVRAAGEEVRDVTEVRVDGRTLDDPVIPLVDDGARHTVLVLVRSPCPD
ncbi:MAG: glucoamylase family protein [Gemmatimonadota bacterium]